MKKKTILIFLVLTLLAAVVSGCQNGERVSSDPNRKKKVTVYTSFYALYDFTKKIGGDKINLLNLVPPGTEPHEWEPTPKDIAGLQKADLLIYNGAGMEGWIDKVLGSVKNRKLVAVETSKGLRLLDNPSHEGLEYDPHVWLNPLLAKKQMETIKNSLIAVDPANKDYYEKNFAENAEKIDELDQEYRNSAAKFTRKDIVVAHQAFGYLAAAYGLKQVPIEGLNADAEPTPARMAEIANYARENNVKYIFFEELISPKVANAIAREVGAKTEVLDPFEGPQANDTGAGKEYFAVMRKNLAVLEKALR